MIPALLLQAALAAAPDPMAVDTYSEAYALTQEVTGLSADTKRYEGARWIGQAGFGRWGVAVRASIMGLPGTFKKTDPQTYRSAEAEIIAHRNVIQMQDVTCGPAALLGYAVSLDQSVPTFARNMTSGLGAQCASQGRTVIVLAGTYMPLPGLSGMAGVIWPLTQSISWQADFAFGARQQRVARIAVAISVWRGGKK